MINLQERRVEHYTGYLHALEDVVRDTGAVAWPNVKEVIENLTWQAVKEVVEKTEKEVRPLDEEG